MESIYDHLLVEMWACQKETVESLSLLSGGDTLELLSEEDRPEL